MRKHKTANANKNKKNETPAQLTEEQASQVRGGISRSVSANTGDEAGTLKELLSFRPK